VGGGFVIAALVVVVALISQAAPKVHLDLDAAPVARPSAQVEPAASVATTATAPSSPTTLPGPLTTSGHESRELKALLDDQQRLLQACIADATKCGRWTRFSKETLMAPANPISAPPPASDGPRDGWLQRLKVPKDFPAETDSRLKEIFDYDARRPTGRTGFNVKYFECSAYEDIIDAALLKYEAPTWLKAVVFQESGCVLTATSPVGAKGLWQFMPESARAYGLRVSEGEIDQRLDPVRSTDAGIRFLTDLRKDVGAWDLALAGYNMGPYGVIRRVQQMGGKASFRDLAQADLLPQETSLYVPNIEAFALVLENMRSLHLGGSGKHPESTSEITVKSGTRLSLIARAGHTSTLHIKELNRAYLGDVVPEGETTAWVPDAEAHRAQLFFDTPGPDDRVDTCVPEDFDWGTTVLETSKYAQQCAPKP
jgi:hypothetical protein